MKSDKDVTKIKRVTFFSETQCIHAHKFHQLSFQLAIKCVFFRSRTSQNRIDPAYCDPDPLARFMEKGPRKRNGPEREKITKTKKEETERKKTKKGKDRRTDGRTDGRTGELAVMAEGGVIFQ